MNRRIGSEKNVPPFVALTLGQKVVDPRGLEGIASLNVDVRPVPGKMPVELEMAMPTRNGTGSVPVSDINNPAEYQYADAVGPNAVTVNNLRVPIFTTWFHPKQTMVFRAGESYLAIGCVKVDENLLTYEWKHWPPEDKGR